MREYVEVEVVAPNAAKTEVYTTFDIEQWRHVLSVRLDQHAQWEIRLIIQQVYDYLKSCSIFVDNLKTYPTGQEL